MHIGRSWSGTPLEDECPCPKAPCGLVDQRRALDEPQPPCEQHLGHKTMRQGHEGDQCPALPMSERVGWLMAVAGDLAQGGDEAMAQRRFADALAPPTTATDPMGLRGHLDVWTQGYRRGRADALSTAVSVMSQADAKDILRSLQRHVAEEEKA